MQYTQFMRTDTKKSPAPPPALRNWIETRMLAKIARRDDLALVVGVQLKVGSNGIYDVIALEVPWAVAQNEGMAGVFSNHSHAIVASDVKGITKAKRKAVAYLNNWRNSDTSLARCECGPIATDPAPGAPSLSMDEAKKLARELSPPQVSWLFYYLTRKGPAPRAVTRRRLMGRNLVTQEGRLTDKGLCVTAWFQASDTIPVRAQRLHGPI